MRVALEQIEAVLGAFAACAQADEHVDVGDVLGASQGVSAREEMTHELVQRDLARTQTEVREALNSMLLFNLDSPASGKASRACWLSSS